MLNLFGGVLKHPRDWRIYFQFLGSFEFYRGPSPSFKGFSRMYPPRSKNTHNAMRKMNFLSPNLETSNTFSSQLVTYRPLASLTPLGVTQGLLHFTVKMTLNVLNLGHERTADCNVMHGTQTAVSWMKALCLLDPSTSPSAHPMCVFSLFKLLHHTPGALFRSVYCCCGWVYIVVNGTPGAFHTGAKGCLVHRYRMLIIVIGVLGLKGEHKRLFFFTSNAVK